MQVKRNILFSGYYVIQRCVVRLVVLKALSHEWLHGALPEL